MDRVDEIEYSGQPEYVQRLFSLTDLNKMVDKVNRLLNAKMEGKL